MPVKKPIIYTVMRHITTCRDNESFDMAKIAGLCTLAMTFILTSYDVFILGAHFQAISFGGACTSIITGTCLGMFFKKDTEPQREEGNNAN